MTEENVKKKRKIEVLNKKQVKEKEKKVESHEVEKTIKIHQKKHYSYSDKKKDVIECIEKVKTIENEEQKQGLLREIYEKAVKEFPIGFFWKKRIQNLFECYQKLIIKKEEVVEAIEESLLYIVYDYNDMGEVIEEIIRIFYFFDEEEECSSYLDKIFDLRITSISFPHKKIENSFCEVSKFISEYKLKDYESSMIKANRVYAETKKQQVKYDKFEIEVNFEPQDLRKSIEYMNFVSCESVKNNPNHIIVLFYRLLFFIKEEINDIKKFWLNFISLLNKNTKTEGKVLIILEEKLKEFVRIFPESAISYCELIVNCSRFSNKTKIYEETREKLFSNDVVNKSDYDESKLLLMSIIQFQLNEILDFKRIELKKSLYNDILDFFDLALTKNDPYHSVEKVLILTLEKLEEHETSHVLSEKLIEVFEEQLNVWVFLINHYLRIGNFKEFYFFKQKALDKAEKIDNFEKIYDILVEIQMESSNLKPQSDLFLIAGLNKKNKNKNKNSQISQSKKLELLPKDNEVKEKRSREQYTVILSKIPPEYNKDSVNSLFSSFAKTRSVLIYEENNLTNAIVELSSDDEVFLAVSKTFPDDISVKRFVKSLLFVSNYPPSFSQSSLKSLFNNYGFVISMRFPSQKKKITRRFCYVEYSNPNHASKALESLHGFILNDPISKKNYSLSVKLSDPPKNNNKPLWYKRVVVKNLPLDCDESLLRSIFNPCGDIDHILFPRLFREKKKFSNNDGVAIISYNDLSSVRKALLLNHNLLKNKIISVSSYSLQSSKTTIKIDHSLCFGIINIDNSISRQQLIAFITEKSSSPSRTIYFPDYNAAIVFFKTSFDSGKSSLALNNIKLENNYIKVVDPTSILEKTGNSKSERVERTNKLMVPISVQLLKNKL